MITPFRMKDTVGRSYTTNLDDTYNLKRALAGLGHIDTTKGTLDRYPDGAMLKGIESFQREQGLKVDGIVRPDGPTHQRLNAILGGIGRSAGRPSTNVTPQSDRISTSCFPGDQVEQPQVKLDEPVTSSGNVVLSDAQKVKSALEFLGVTRTGAQSDPYPSHDLFRGIRDFQKREGLRVDGEMRPGGETEQRMNALLEEAEGLGVPTQQSDSQNGVQVAAAPVNKSMGRRYGPEGALILDQYTGGGTAGLSAAAAAAILLDSKRKKAGFSEEVPGMSDRQSNSYRTDVAPPLPPLPGYEPPDDEDSRDRRVDHIKPLELPDFSRPMPDTKEPTIFVLPVPKDGEFGSGIVERKGNEATRKELERIRDYFIEKGWVHLDGGRYSSSDPEVLAGRRKEGDERREHYIPGYFKKLKGGHFTDLTFQDDRGRIVHIQSVDVDRNGKPTRRELENAEKIRKKLEKGNILLIPKRAQLDRHKKD